MTDKKLIDESIVELESLNQLEIPPPYVPVSVPLPTHTNPIQPRDHVFPEPLPETRAYAQRNNRDARQTATRWPALATRRVNVPPPPKPRGFFKVLAVVVFASNGYDGIWFSAGLRITLWSIIYWIAAAIYIAIHTSTQAVKPTDKQIWPLIGFGVLAWMILMPCVYWSHWATGYRRPTRYTSVIV